MRVFLHDGTMHDMQIGIPMPAFIGNIIACHGLLFERAWIPESMIKLIAPLDAQEKPDLGPNVVPLRRT